MAVPTVHASAVELYSVQFPEKRTVELPFTAMPIAPSAGVLAEITYRQGQARVEISYSAMKPAILFGGDVTCFVVWAVTRDGQAENLGELLTRKSSGKLAFSTGKKNFALIVTAESYYLVGQPSELLAFYNKPSITAGAASKPFSFDGFAPAPRHSMDGIAHIKWDSKVPLELLQARKALELAERYDAPVHAGQIYTEAQSALKNAYQVGADAPKSRELLDHARRAVALSNEALNISMHRIEAIELERQLAERRAETAALERRAAEAEASAESAERLAIQVRAEVDRVRAERERTTAEIAGLRNEKVSLERSMLNLRQEKDDLQDASGRLQREKTALERESQRLADEKAALERESTRLREEKAGLEGEALRLQREKNELSGRLQAALSHVAETEDSVRGLVINLPDILFDLDAAALKPEAQIILAKLSGILLIMRDQDALIEGHTDATGSADYNVDLSQRRASAVLQFMLAQGLDSQRLSAMGHGMQRPVADNSTPEGRKRNRRVEIVINERGDAVASN
jgi:outer membrane protein OmpA-like peptidoglycan-associated protein